MPTTPIYGLRYPAPSDPADVPTDMGELATDLETLLSTKAVVSNDTHAANEVPVWDGSAWVYQRITNAQVDPAAAISQSKLAFDADQAYTPSFVAQSGGAAVGNGTLQGRYLRIGKLVIFNIELVIGSTTNGGAGNWRFGLPVAAAAFPFTRGAGWGLLYRNATASSLTNVAIDVVANGTDTAPTFATGTPGILGSVNGASPWAWATGDILRLSGVYISA